MKTKREFMHDYNEKLRKNKVKTLSKMCNAAFLSVLLLLIAYFQILAKAFGPTFFICLLFGVLMVIRLIYIYLLAADCLVYKLLYFGMILMISVLTAIGFYMVPFSLYILMIAMILIVFPFIFHKLSQLK